MRLAILFIFLAGCASQQPPATQPAANRPVSLEQAISRGVEFLVRTQSPDGSWGTGLETRGFEVYSMVPGSHDAYRVGTTALCVMALREAGETQAHARGVKYLVESSQARRDNSAILYNIWAHLYTVQALSIELQRKDDPAMRKAIAWHLDHLARYETYTGGWNYYDFHVGAQQPAMGPTSFGTAAGLVALWEAKRAGVALPPGTAERAVRRLSQMRLPNGAYLYAADMRYFPRSTANMPRGSIGRNQACNIALWLWNKDIGPDQVRAGLDEFIAEHQFIEMGRKRPYPHDSWYQTAPYYFYFGHYYAALLVERLAPAERDKYRQHLAGWVLPLQEDDGSWWDFAMWDYHKPYGTAYAIMTLLRCRPSESPRK